MKAAQDIILKPVITEASMSGIADRKYTFKVAKDANKIEIAAAVEALFAGTKSKRREWAPTRATAPIGKRPSSP